MVYSCEEKGTGTPYAAKILKKTVSVGRAGGAAGWGGEVSAPIPKHLGTGGAPGRARGCRPGIAPAVWGSWVEKNAGFRAGGAAGWGRTGDWGHERGLCMVWGGAGPGAGSRGNAASTAGSAFQIDKKIVRTEIGVLLRLSHPNIVSMTHTPHLPPASGSPACPPRPLPALQRGCGCPVLAVPRCLPPRCRMKPLLLAAPLSFPAPISRAGAPPILPAPPPPPPHIPWPEISIW